MTLRTWPGTGGLPAAEYDYPRRLGPGELAAAAGVALGVGLAAFYVARLLAAGTPGTAPPPRNALPTPVPSRAARAAVGARPDASRPAPRRG